MKQFGFTPIFLLVGVLIVATIAGGGYYFLRIKTSSQRACTLEAQVCPDGTSVGRTGPNCEFAPCPTSKPTPTPSVDETANWKTYKSSKGEFTIRYPNSWSIFLKEVQNKQTGQSLTDWIKVKDSIEDRSNQCPGCLKIYSQKERQIGKHQGVIQEVVSHPAGRNMRAYIVKSSSEVAVINGYPVGKNFPDAAFGEKELNEFDLILSTFRFD